MIDDDVIEINPYGVVTGNERGDMQMNSDIYK